MEFKKIFTIVEIEIKLDLLIIKKNFLLNILYLKLLIKIFY